MAGGPIRGALRRTSLAQVRHVSPVRFQDARELVADVYGGMEREFGVLAPPVALHSPAPDVLAGCWLVLRETLVVPGAVPRGVKEAVAAAVSVSNACPYCVTIHSGTMRALLPGRDAAELAADRVEGVADPRVRAIAGWARALPGTGRGAPPFPAEQVPELLGTAVAFHYINRMVNVFLGERPMPPTAPAAAIGPVTRVLTRLMRSAERNVGAPGASLGLLPDAPLPPDLAWAAGSPGIAGAYARFAASVEAAGRAVVRPAVRELVVSELAVWDGRPKGPSRAWLEGPAAALPEADRPAGRLALLTALASYQIDQPVVDAFRAGHPADADLVALTAWSSLMAARYIGAWAGPGDDRPGDR